MHWCPPGDSTWAPFSDWTWWFPRSTLLTTTRRTPINPPLQTRSHPSYPTTLWAHPSLCRSWFTPSPSQAAHSVAQGRGRGNLRVWGRWRDVTTYPWGGGLSHWIPKEISCHRGWVSLYAFRFTRLHPINPMAPWKVHWLWSICQEDGKVAPEAKGTGGTTSTTWERSTPNTTNNKTTTFHFQQVILHWSVCSKNRGTCLWQFTYYQGASIKNGLISSLYIVHLSFSSVLHHSHFTSSVPSNL